MLNDYTINTLMKHAMDLAEKGRGRVSPNPLVGAVIVSDSGEILAEGWHKEAGDKHAEVNAIDIATASGITDFSDLTLICTLEPCNIWGKTPPCTSAIIQTGFKNIYIGIGDPNPKVNGRGIEILEKAGLNVKVGFIEDLLFQQNAGFIKVMKEMRPFTTLKLAVSADGYLSEGANIRTKITNPKQDLLVHRLRAAQDAILVGIGTVRADDPLLTVRNGIERSKPLTRVILDSNATIDASSEIVRTAKEIPTMVVISENLSIELADHIQKVSALEDKGVKVLAVPANGSTIDLEILTTKLAELGICYLLVEGGEAVASSFLRAGLVDKLDLFHGDIAIRSENMKIRDAIEEKTIWPLRSQIDELELGEALALEKRRFILTLKNKELSEFIA